MHALTYYPGRAEPAFSIFSIKSKREAFTGIFDKVTVNFIGRVIDGNVSLLSPPSAIGEASPNGAAVDKSLPRLDNVYSACERSQRRYSQSRFSFLSFADRGLRARKRSIPRIPPSTHPSHSESALSPQFHFYILFRISNRKFDAPHPASLAFLPKKRVSRHRGQVFALFEGQPPQVRSPCCFYEVHG